MKMEEVHREDASRAMHLWWLGIEEKGTRERPLSAMERSAGSRSADSSAGRPAIVTSPSYALSSEIFTSPGSTA